MANDPVVCVLAGAGTGKTRVLTLRVARRVRDRSAHATHVLVCTFSRRAAEELRDRLWTLGIGSEVKAGTFHRTALRLIAQHRQDRGQPPPAVVADRRPLLAELLADRRPLSGELSGGGLGTPRGRAYGGSHPVRRGNRRRSDVSRLDAEIGWAKARLVAPCGYEAAARQAGRRASVPAARVAELYERYESARRLRGVLDLDDLLWHCGDLLEQDDAFARGIRWWHRHVFVDEMQDLNDAQYRLLRLLVGEEPDLFVVGDPNQSVYGWNGADPDLLRRVTEEFAGTRVVHLETNHRCTAPVVRIAAAALGRGQPPPAARPDGAPPTVTRLANDEEEARWVARHVWLARHPGTRWSSIAVLARTNAQLARIATALDAEHVPSAVSGAELGPASDVRAGRGRAAEDDGSEAPGTGRTTYSHGVTAGGDTGGDAGGHEGGDAGEDAVVLSTFHRAKGLQWRCVFVVGVSDGLVPLVTARSSAAKAEERRLFYVALTRAEEELACTWALRPDGASAFDGAAERRASPWLSSVEQALAELHEGAAEASPALAAAHLAAMRDLLPPSPAGLEERTVSGR